MKDEHHDSLGYFIQAKLAAQKAAILSIIQEIAEKYSPSRNATIALAELATCIKEL